MVTTLSIEIPGEIAHVTRLSAEELRRGLAIHLE
jgi:hypothetical protein